MTTSQVYFYTFKANVKERWKNKQLIDVLSSEFVTRPRDYFFEAINSGVITVNEKTVSPCYKLKLVDYIKHTVHIHEPHVPEIEIIKQEEEYIVVNKPPGVPCHPTGAYVQYSITRKLFGDMKVACVNRLDMPVSGILIITYKNLRNSMIKINDTEKIYIAKVKGKFPKDVECDFKIFCEGNRRRFVNEKGKYCLTKFKLIKSNDIYSLVECRPITGRTHQIRIHLQALGFPIINDLIYAKSIVSHNENNSHNYSVNNNVEIHNYEKCDKEMVSHKINDMENSYEEIIETGNFKIDNNNKGNCTAKWNVEEDKEKMNCVLKYCKGENNRSFDLQNNFICLHAWKYKFNGIWYESKWPKWANID